MTKKQIKGEAQQVDGVWWLWTDAKAETIRSQKSPKGFRQWRKNWEIRLSWETIKRNYENRKISK